MDPRRDTITSPFVN